jgi:hypothetical protein
MRADKKLFGAASRSVRDGVVERASERRVASEHAPTGHSLAAVSDRSQGSPARGLVAPVDDHREEKE